MPNIGGYVFYDESRMRTGTTAISGVPVCLYDEAGGRGIVAITSASGMFYFSGVPSGSYTIIECFGASGRLSPVSYSTATAMAKPEPADPPISLVPSPITGANKLDSLTPNTLFVELNYTDIVNLIFFDGPIEERPLAVFGGTPVGANLLTNANGGNWGDLQDGTPINSIAPTNEYPGMLSGLNYNPEFPPLAGNVAYDNIPTGYPEWWYVADHTTGMETGRMIVVDGSNPGAAFFKETVTLKANTYYALTMWIVNMNNPTPTPTASAPRLGIIVEASNGTVLFRDILQELPQANPPQWTQIGGLFYNALETSASITISTESADPSGNDYSVDDIVLTEAEVPDALKLEKSASQSPVAIGETVTYSVDLMNPSDIIAKNVQFQDTLAANITFVAGSVTVDGTTYDTYDPTAGFLLGDMVPGSSHLITYQIIVDDNSVNPIPNKAEASYDIFASQSGDIYRRTIYSNTVLTYVTRCNLRQAGVDILESIALVGAALAHIENAEGEKLQKAALMDLSTEELLKVQGSAANMFQSIAVLEDILLSKAEMIKPQISC